MTSVDIITDHADCTPPAAATQLEILLLLHLTHTDTELGLFLLHCLTFDLLHTVTHSQTPPCLTFLQTKTIINVLSTNSGIWQFA